MDTLCYVCLYNDYGINLGALSDEEFGRLTRAMIRYNTTGDAPEFTGNERFVWPIIRSQIDRNRKAYEKKCETNRRNGQKGGRPKKRFPPPRKTTVSLPNGSPEPVNSQWNTKDKEEIYSCKIKEEPLVKIGNIGYHNWG